MFRAWFTLDVAIGIGFGIRPHPRVPMTCGGTSDHDRSRPWNRPCGPASQAVLEPLQKYETFLQLVRQEVTVIEAAEHWQVNRGVVMRIRTVAEEGALGALPESRPGRRAKERDFELEAARTDAPRRGLEGDGCQAHASRGERALGLSGGVPRRVDAATKASILELLVAATDAGLSRCVPGTRTQKDAPTAGWAVETPASSPTGRPEAAPCTGCSTTKWSRSSPNGGATPPALPLPPTTKLGPLVF